MGTLSRVGRALSEGFTGSPHDFHGPSVSWAIVKQRRIHGLPLMRATVTSTVTPFNAPSASLAKLSVEGLNRYPQGASSHETSIPLRDAAEADSRLLDDRNEIGVARASIIKRVEFSDRG